MNSCTKGVKRLLHFLEGVFFLRQGLACYVAQAGLKLTSKSPASSSQVPGLL